MWPEYQYLDLFSPVYSFESFQDIRIGSEFRYDRKWMIKVSENWGREPNARERAEDVYYNIPVYKKVCVLNKKPHKIT